MAQYNFTETFASQSFIDSALASGNTNVEGDILYLEGTPLGRIGSTTNKVAGETMNKVTAVAKDVATDAFGLNKDAVIEAAKLEGGTLALNGVMKAYVKLPWGFGKLKKSPLVRLAVANVANSIICAFVKKKEVTEGSKYMVKAAMNDAVKQLDIVAKIEKIVGGQFGKFFKKD